MFQCCCRVFVKPGGSPLTGDCGSKRITNKSHKFSQVCLYCNPVIGGQWASVSPGTWNACYSSQCAPLLIPATLSSGTLDVPIPWPTMQQMSLSSFTIVGIGWTTRRYRKHEPTTQTYAFVWMVPAEGMASLRQVWRCSAIFQMVGANCYIDLANF